MTPFDERDRVDVDALERLAEDVLAAGAAGVVVLATTGEPTSLDDGERRRRAYYVRPTEAAIVAHFQLVAARCPVPVVVYNVPYRTGGVSARRRRSSSPPPTTSPGSSRP